ncbi:MAG: prephenate dehydratase [bacterium]
MNKTSKTIVYLGPAGSYSEVAAEKAAEILGYDCFQPLIKPSITKVIELIDNNNDYIGVVPLENSIEGIVRETIDNLAKTTSRVMMVQEVIIPISHCLISKSTNIADIDKILSYSPALAQCLNFISNMPKSVELINVSSTSEAVKQLANLPENHAAIGSFKASQIYKLNVIAKEINDEKDNKTRFVCLDSYIPKITGNDKTSIAFSTCNQPGNLVNVLLAFKENNINLSYIESRPSKKVFGDYTFFVDFDGHIENENIQKTLGRITPFINFYRFLGSYPKFNLNS